MKKSGAIGFSIVLPVYNTTNSLIEFVKRTEKVFREKVKEDFEIIFVDDASPNPETWKTLEELARKNSHVKVIQLMRNFGQHAATLCGLSVSSGDYVITMDDDLQQSPEDIPKLIEQKEFDIVIGQYEKKKHSLFKNITSRIKGWYDRALIGKPKDIQLTSFRMFSRGVVDAMLSIRTQYPFIPALMFYVSKNVIGIPVSHVKRAEGKSGYNLLKMIKLFSNLLINNSSFLLKTTGYLGMFISALSFIFAINLIYHKIMHGTTLQGWTSLMVSFLFIGGLILFILGVIGEYLFRIIVGIESKPAFIIRKSESLNRYNNK
jgi:glycosyltransferase involved in cell wall biosynthesis